MKTISTELQAHLAGECTTLATCWKLTRKDGTVMGFTDHDQDFTYSDVLYIATSGFTPSSISTNANMAVDTQDIEGMLSSDSINEADILAGLYDSAEIEIFMVNYTDLTQGDIKLKKGWLGEVSLKNNQFIAEVRGLTQKLTQTIGELYSPSCRATLGDSRCKVDLSSHQFTTTITTSPNKQRLICSSLTQESGDFTGGTILFTSGANSGLGMEIKEHAYIIGTGADINLVLPLPYDIQPSDSVTVTRGCDKTLGTCKGKFDNIVNFRGEPHVPGLDKMFETAGTRS